MIEILSAAELVRAKETGALVADILQAVKSRATVGTNLLDIDRWTKAMIARRRGAVLLRRLRAVVRARAVRALHLHRRSTTRCSTACRTTTRWPTATC